MATVIKSIHAEWADDTRSGAYWLVTADVIVNGHARTIQAKAWSLHDVVPALHETIERG